MQLVIIAGGLGKRLRPITANRPKALVPLVDRPLILHTLDRVPRSCDEVLIPVNYRFDQVRDFFRKYEFRVPVRVVDEPKPLGTAGAIKNVERYLQSPFAVFNGDVVDTIDVDDLFAVHRKGHGIGTIAVWPVDDASDFGVVSTDDGRITQFTEKPTRRAPGLVNAGRYVFEASVFDFIDAGREVSLERDVFPRLLDHRLVPYRYDGWWSDAGTLPNYLHAQRLLLRSGLAKIAAEADVKGGALNPPVYVAAGTFVEGSVGPDVVLGRSCRIGRAALRDAALFEGASVDDKAEIVASIVGAGAAVGEASIVRDSIVGEGAQIPPRAAILGQRVEGRAP